MKAIILSAGQGKRLLPLTQSRPKCLLPLAGATLLEWQLRHLAQAGVTEAVVVTGFEAKSVDAAVARLHIDGLTVRTIFNPFYSVADNLGSCWAARHEMNGDFLLLNGDTLFEPEVARTVLAAARAPITVTIDRKPHYDADDMKVQTDGDRLLAIAKTLPLDIVDGESIGMLVFRGDGGQRFGAVMADMLADPDGLRLWYLSAIDRLAGRRLVQVASIAGLDWCELDFPLDVSRAEALARKWAARLAAAPAAESPLRAITH